MSELPTSPRSILGSSSSSSRQLFRGTCFRCFRSQRFAIWIVIYAILLSGIPLPTSPVASWAAIIEFDQEGVAASPSVSSSTSRFLFGPENFVRRRGKPQAITRTFTVANPSSSATLCVVNGGWRSQYLRVSSADITLNKVKVLQPKDFAPRRKRLARAVTLQANNTLTVAIASQPGSGFTLWIANGNSCDGNTPPVANAGPDQTGTVGQRARLDGSASSDADGNRLTFRWSFVSKPTGSTATLLNAAAVKPTFQVDLPGSYTLQLIVNDGKVDSDPDTVVISTQNSKPVANAGADQTVPLGTRVTLDGSQSKDPDGNTLSYRWELLAAPDGSTTSLENATTATPSLLVDAPGSYLLQLIVNDGKVDSDPDTVTINTQNSKPLANAGPDQTVTAGTTVQLDGSGSSDADHDPLTYQWSLTTFPGNTAPPLSNATAQKTTFVPAQAGLYVVQLVVSDGKEESDPDTASITVNVLPPPNHPPVANAGQDQHVAKGATVHLDGSGSTDPDPNTTLTYQWTFALKPGSSTTTLTEENTATPSFVADVTETFTVQLIVNDGQASSIADTVMITVADCLPNTTQGCYTGPTGTAGVGICHAGTRTCSAQGAFGACIGEVLPGTEIPNNDIDEDCNGSDQTTGGGGLPPDPGTVAPPVDQGVATIIGAATQFLYTGANPIQTGIVPGTIELKRAAILRGKVLNKNNAPLSGVTITILNHPEFGQTVSRTDGMLDLAVNGGGLLTVNYAKAGYLSAQRQLQTPWQDYAWLPDVVLIPYDSHSTLVDLTANTYQVAQGSITNDARGTRQATLLFAPGTQATMSLPNGSTQPLTTLHVRATEQSVGDNGPESTTAEEPPTAAYTYGVDFSADEAIAAKALSVDFNQPVILYLQNFIGFPVGGGVPVGGYDSSTGVWVPHPNGRIVKILNITNGQATLDVKGNGQAASAAELAELGITDPELQEVGRLYPAGQALWRAPIPHFSYWDT